MSDDYPLSGIRVLDLSRVLAGPYAGRMLSDLGAEVVKVEPPEGDITRKWGKRVGPLRGYYVQQNVGKRSVCIDLRVDGGAELVRRLADHADVLVENFRPGVMAQYGLDYQALRARNPKLIMLSITGFGQQGPESARPAYAGVVHAESGILQRQAVTDGTAPNDVRFSVADMNVALHGLVALLSAVVMRQRTGVGQHIDMAMIDSMVATDDYTHATLDGLKPPLGVVNEVWEVAGGPILFAGDFRFIWSRLRDTHKLEDPTPAGAPLETKIRCRREAVERFLTSFKTREAVLAALAEADLPVGEVRSQAQALRSPTLEARGSVVQVDDRAGGRRPVIQSPYRFSGARSGAHGEVALQGEHNRAVLADWLGLGAQECDQLEASGVLLASAPRASS